MSLSYWAKLMNCVVDVSLFKGEQKIDFLDSKIH